MNLASAFYDDEQLSVVVKEFLKSKPNEWTDEMKLFVDLIPELFKQSTDKMSNSRLKSLVKILDKTELEYKELPATCKDFVRNVFLCCAVKTEISDKNKTEFQGMFKNDPKKYYAMFNKAFAGLEGTDSWVDRPTNKLTFQQMVNYAEFQDAVLGYKNSTGKLDKNSFYLMAKALKLPKLPPYESEVLDARVYLNDNRDYKTLSKEMAKYFAGFVMSEADRLNEKMECSELKPEDIFELTPTSQMTRMVKTIDVYSNGEQARKNYAYFLMGLVHLDKLMEKSKAEIYGEEFSKNGIKTSKTIKIKPVKTKKPSGSRNSIEKEEEYELNLKLKNKIFNQSCSEEDLDDLLELEENLRKGAVKNANGINLLDVENAIFELEQKTKD